MPAMGNVSYGFWNMMSIGSGHPDLLKRLLGNLKKASKLDYTHIFDLVYLIFNWLAWSDPAKRKATDKRFSSRPRSLTEFLSGVHRLILSGGRNIPID
jgi:hypothetical protein